MGGFKFPRLFSLNLDTSVRQPLLNNTNGSSAAAPAANGSITSPFAFLDKLFFRKKLDTGVQTEEEEKVYNWLYAIARSDRNIVYEYVKSTELAPSSENVVNNFPVAGLEIQLHIHCKSSDDNIGDQVVGPGKGVTFSISPNFFGTTLFHCKVMRNDPNGAVKFDAYDYHRDAGSRCSSKCDWSINGEGAFRTDQSTGAQDLSFPWEPTLVY